MTEAKEDRCVVPDRRNRGLRNRPRPALLASLVCATFHVALAPVATGQVLVAEDENFSNSSFVPESDDLKAALFAGDHAASKGEWADALLAYQTILERFADDAVAFSDRLWLSGFEAVRRRVGQLPTEASAEYEKLFGEKASALLQQGLREFDPALLMRIADRYPFTQAGVAALRGAATFAAERGEWIVATRAIDELRRRGGATPSDLLRHADALRQANQRDELLQFIASIPVDFDADVVIAGERTALRGRLDEWSDEQRRGEDEVLSRALREHGISVVPLTSFPYEERLSAIVDKPDPLRRSPVLSWPAIGGAVRDGSVWFLGQLGLYRIEKPTAEAEPLARYDRDFGKVSHSVIGDRQLQPIVEDGKVYLTFTERFDFQRPPIEASQLVCVDAENLGVVFRVLTAGSRQPDAYRDFVFEGPPQRFDDLIILIGSRLRADTEVKLFAFDADSGELRWSKGLASGARIGRYEYRNQAIDPVRASPSPIAIAGGVAYCSTNVGVIAAVDLLSERVLWRFRYNRASPTDPDRYTAEAYYDSGGWNRTPPVVMGERLIVAPEDSRFLYILARTPSPEGYLRLQEPLFKGDREALLAVDRSRGLLIFSARKTVGPTRDEVFLAFESLSAVGVGRAYETTPFQVEEQISGSPLLVGSLLVVPTSKRLCLVDLTQQGKIIAAEPLPAVLARGNERRYFGNLSRHGTTLLSTSPSYALEIRAAE